MCFGGGYQKGWYTFQLTFDGGQMVTHFYKLTRHMYAFIRIQVLFAKNSILSLQWKIWYDHIQMYQSLRKTPSVVICLDFCLSPHQQLYEKSGCYGESVPLSMLVRALLLNNAICINGSCMFFLWFCQFSMCVGLGQMWYLTVSSPDLCLLIFYNLLKKLSLKTSFLKYY